MSERVAALERQADELEAFHDCARQAREWLQEHATDELVSELREARENRRRMKLGTINTLILLAHIDALEAARGPVMKP